MAFAIVVPHILTLPLNLLNMSSRRHRGPVALLLRIAFCALPVAMGANLVPALPDRQDSWHALGRLFLIARR